MISCCSWRAQPEVVTAVQPNECFRKPVWDGLFAKNRYALEREYIEIRRQRNSGLCFDPSIAICPHPQNVSSLEGFLYDIFKNNTDLIIMLVQNQEIGFTYLVDSYSSQFFSFTKETLSTGFSWDESRLRITLKGENKIVKEVSHFHYKLWVDNDGADPKDVARLARLGLEAKKPLIHCRGGIGRSGTLAAVISAYKKIQNGDYAPDLIQRTVLESREIRQGHIGTLAQYLCVYDSLRILLEEDGLLS